MSLKNMIVVALLGLFVLLPYQAKADRLDILETYNSVEYCKQVTGMFYSGAQSRVDGHARVIKQPGPVEIGMMEHRLPLPKSAIWAMQWNELNDREKEFMSLHVFLGYDSNPKDEDEASASAQAFFEACIRHRVAEKRI